MSNDYMDGMFDFDGDGRADAGEEIMEGTVQNVCSRWRMSVHPMAEVLTRVVLMTGIAASVERPRSTSSPDG